MARRSATISGWIASETVDKDGFCGESFAAPRDCDDQQAEVNTDAEELANAVEEDCNGIVDDGLSAAL